MTGSDDDNVLSTRYNMIEKQSEMIVELTRNLEKLQEEMNRTRNLANLAITANASVQGGNKPLL